MDPVADEPRNPFDMLSNDILSRVLAECERHTECRRVCRRFAAVYERYRLWDATRRMLFADWIINLSGGTAQWVGMDTSPTRIAFHERAPAYAASRDCYALWSALCEQNANHCCWLSPRTHKLHLAALAPRFRPIAAFDLQPYVEGLGPNANREWKIELGSTVVVVWAKGEGFFAVYDLGTLQLALLCHQNNAIARVDRLALVGSAEHVAITVGKPVVQLMVVAHHSLEPLFPPIPGAVVAMPVHGPDRALVDRCIVAGPGGFVLDANASTWDAHYVSMLDLRDQRELWRLDNVAPDANLRVPGARSSGVADRLVARSSALALCSGAIVSTADGSALLPPFAAGDVTTRDALHFLCDDGADEGAPVGRVLLLRRLEMVGSHRTAVARFEPMDSKYAGFRFHVLAPLGPARSVVLDSISLTGVGFVVCNGVLVFGVTHNKGGRCGLRAVRLPRAHDATSEKKTLWRAALPDEMKQWRLKLYASHEKVTALYYPVEATGKLCPKVAFFWLATGQQSGDVVTLAARTDTDKKCSVM